MDVLEAADMLLMDAARDSCWKWLVDHLSLDSCILVAAATMFYLCPQWVKDESISYIRRHFYSVFHSNDALENAPSWLLYEILSSPELVAEKEDRALQVLSRWWDRQDAVEEDETRALLRCIRIGRCTEVFLEEFPLNGNAIADTAAYVAEVTEALARGPCRCNDSDFMRLLGQRGQLPPLLPAPAENAAEPDDDGAVTERRCPKCMRENPERWLPRYPHQIVVVLGGIRAQETHRLIQAYDETTKLWIQAPAEDFAERAGHDVVVVDKMAYIIGGRRGTQTLRSVEALDLVTCKWMPRCPLNIPRAFVASAATGKHIYAIGGHTGQRRLSSVECYNTDDNQWLEVASMNSPRSAASACEVNGRVLVSGGNSGAGMLASVEVYDPLTDQWTFLRSLPHGRCSHRMLLHSGTLFVIGGWDGERHLRSVLTNRTYGHGTWQAARSMNRARRSFATVATEDTIIAIGGWDGEDIDSAEEFHLSIEEWVSLPSLRVAVSATADFLAKGLPATRRYSARGALLQPDGSF